MKLPVLTTLQGYKKENLPKDLLSGVVIAAVSIPISMGYAQIAGLPAVYGLYGSVLPVLLFALFSTSPQFIFGVDAAPAAMVGAVLSSLGVALGSGEAVALVPVLTFYTSLWLLLFAALRAGKVLNFISTPVMGGFISGICCTIILMQTPKLLGGTAGTGELPELMRHLIAACGEIHWLSLALGLAALGILLAGKRLFPKFPMAIAIMALGAVCSVALDLPTRGVATLAAVEPGLPPLRLPDLRLLSPAQALGSTLPVAVVIMAETLLAENSFALRGDYTLRDNREILTFSLSNFAACLVGCCPVNGSVSRSSMNEQYGGRTQAVSLIAAAVMSCMLLLGTGFIQYLPIPVLTAIVISALMGATEFHIAHRLFRADRKEVYIFAGAFLGVLVLGTIYGVIIGVLLSFIEFPLLPGVTWLKYDASAMPAMVSGFAFGPAAGLAVGIVGAVIHGILMADFSGAVMNILVIMGFVWPAALIYAKRHTLKGAIAGLAVGVVAATVMAIVGNLLVTPSWLGVPLQAVIDMIVPILTPFNLIKAVLNSVLTLVVYKSISNLVTPKKKQVKGRK